MRRVLKRSLAILLVLLTIFLYGFDTVPVAAYKFGMSGDTVREIQRRLRDWGYYFGSVDGYYGKQTENAVIWFQEKHRIRIDGIVGAQTAEKLGIPYSTGGGSTGAGSGNSNDVYLLAKVVYGESRGEPYTGKVAVAAVILNRVDSSKFPDTIAEVVYQPGAFSVVDDGQINLSPDQDALRAARDAINGWDPSGGAVFYYNPAKISANSWMWTRPVLVTIGDHNFCR